MIGYKPKIISSAELGSSVEPDIPFRVLEGGKVMLADDFAPTIWGEEGHDPTIYGYSDWEFFSHGYTNQHSYNGPEMHASERLGGALARDILATPGTYVLVIVTYDCSKNCLGHAPDCGEYCSDSPHAESWVVVKRR